MRAQKTVDSPRVATLLSVIIPAFNSEGTIERAVKSVLGQSETDLEVIVIDDGSSDNTVQILQRLHESVRDNRLSLILLPENGGVSNARNIGISRAKGTWLAFLDSDDTWDDTLAESALSQVDDATDAVIVGHRIVDASGTVRDRMPVDSARVDGPEAAGKVLSARFSSYLWDKVIRKSLFDATGVRFSGSLPIAEDVAVLVPVIWGARKVITVPQPLVTYYISGSSTTWSTDFSPGLGMEIVSEIARNFEKIGVDANSVPQLAVKKVSVLLDVVNAAARIADPVKRESYIAKARSLINIKDILEAARHNLVFASAAILLKASPSLYRRLYGAYTKKAYAL